jgi:hypothetical protein
MFGPEWFACARAGKQRHTQTRGAANADNR